MIHLGNIEDIRGANVPLVDIVTGGSPCQDLSIAGGRAGLDGKRSGLFMEQIRLIKEMRDESRRQLSVRGTGDDLRRIRPRYMVWENVLGAFSSNKGEDFRTVLEETARVAQGDAVVPRPAGGCGVTAGASWAMGGLLLGEYMTRSFGEYPNEERGSRLSQILEENPLPKYSLSATACIGILNRAEKRGKALPEILRNALIRQSRSLSGQAVTGGGKGILIQRERVGTLSTFNNQSVLSWQRSSERRDDLGGGSLQDA